MELPIKFPYWGPWIAHIPPKSNQVSSRNSTACSARSSLSSLQTLYIHSSASTKGLISRRLLPLLDLSISMNKNLWSEALARHTEVETTKGLAWRSRAHLRRLETSTRFKRCNLDKKSAGSTHIHRAGSVTTLASTLGSATQLGLEMTRAYCVQRHQTKSWMAINLTPNISTT